MHQNTSYHICDMKAGNEMSPKNYTKKVLRRIEKGKKHPAKKVPQRTTMGRTKESPESRPKYLRRSRRVS